MPEKQPPIELAGLSLDALARAIDDRAHPPVDR